MIRLHYFKQQENRVVGIYINREDPSSFILGKVIEAENNWLLMRTISLGGAYDGWFLCKTDLVYLIESDSAYVREHTPSPENDRDKAEIRSIEGFQRMLVQKQKKVRLGGITRRTIANGIVLGTDGEYLVVRGEKKIAADGKSRRIKTSRIFYYSVEENLQGE